MVGTYISNKYSENELYHYGVKGMRWGIRRYEKYDGNRTRKKIERFNKQSTRYDNAVNKYKTRKANGESNTSIKNAKRSMTYVKADMKSAYRQVQRAKRADQGALLAAKGQTISRNSLNANAAFIASIAIGRYFMRHPKMQTRFRFTPKNSKRAIAATTGALAAIGAVGIATAYGYKKQYDNNRLRAYRYYR